MAAIKKRSLVDQVYERLRSDIINLRLPLGSKVNVNELQDTLGVSCTPIREAVNRLQQEGLVTYENNVGARVLTLEATDVEEIQQLATTLHCAAARLAMERGSHEVMAEQLRRRLGEFRAAETPAALTNAVHHFIEVFYVHCGNRRLDRSMLSIQGQQLILRSLYARAGMDKEADAADFEAICRAVEQGEAAAVYRLLGEYSLRVEQAVTASLDGRGTP